MSTMETEGEDVEDTGGFTHSAQPCEELITIPLGFPAWRNGRAWLTSWPSIPVKGANHQQSGKKKISLQKLRLKGKISTIMKIR